MSVAKKFLDENLGKVFLIQKQPPEVFCKKRCSQKFRIIHRKTPSQFCNFNKKRPWHRCFPVNFVIFLRTTFSYRTQPGDCLYWFLSSLTHHHHHHHHHHHRISVLLEIMLPFVLAQVFISGDVFSRLSRSFLMKLRYFEVFNLG